MKRLLINSLKKVLADNDLPSIKEIEKLKPKFAKAAQKVYDEWEVDEDGYDAEVGVGGICHLIADAILEEIPGDFEAVSISSDHEVHVWVALLAEEGIYQIDIPHGLYETGGGYNWTKIPDVQFESSDIIIEHIAHVNEWDNYQQ